MGAKPAWSPVLVIGFLSKGDRNQWTGLLSKGDGNQWKRFFSKGVILQPVGQSLSGSSANYVNFDLVDCSFIKFSSAL